jgi:predicted PurR-regulated permease PerM
MKPDIGTVKTLAIGAALLVGFALLAQGALRLANLWILVFGSVVVAVVLRAIADPLTQKLRWRDGPAVAAAALSVLLFVAGSGYLFGQQISIQVEQLVKTLPAAWDQVEAQITASPAISALADQLTVLRDQAGSFLARAPRYLMNAFSAIATLMLVLVAGVFLATQPAAARDGVLSLLPIDARPRGREVLDACGRALKGWLRAQVFSMVLVGTIIGLGLWIIGVPAPLALGLLTGLAQFVPIVGPIASAVPALLLAATGGMQTLVLTGALYIGVSQLEANLITPLVQKNIAALPAVLGIFAVVGLGILFGPLGVLFATPLALVLYTIVTMVYRQDILGDTEAKAPGDLR